MTAKELKALQQLATTLLGLSAEEVAAAVAVGELSEVDDGEGTQG